MGYGDILSSIYNTIDRSVGGRLPGGVSREQPKKDTKETTGNVTTIQATEIKPENPIPIITSTPSGSPIPHGSTISYQGPTTITTRTEPEPTGQEWKTQVPAGMSENIFKVSQPEVYANLQSQSQAIQQYGNQYAAELNRAITGAAPTPKDFQIRDQWFNMINVAYGGQQGTEIWKDITQNWKIETTPATPFSETMPVPTALEKTGVEKMALRDWDYPGHVRYAWETQVAPWLQETWKNVQPVVSDVVLAKQQFKDQTTRWLGENIVKPYYQKEIQPYVTGAQYIATPIAGAAMYAGKEFIQPGYELGAGVVRGLTTAGDTWIGEKVAPTVSDVYKIGVGVTTGIESAGARWLGSTATDVYKIGSGISRGMAGEADRFIGQRITPVVADTYRIGAGVLGGLSSSGDKWIRESVIPPISGAARIGAGLFVGSQAVMQEAERRATQATIGAGRIGTGLFFGAQETLARGERRIAEPIIGAGRIGAGIYLGGLQSVERKVAPVISWIGTEYYKQKIQPKVETVETAKMIGGATMYAAPYIKLGVEEGVRQKVKEIKAPFELGLKVARPTAEAFSWIGQEYYKQKIQPKVETVGFLGGLGVSGAREAGRGLQYLGSDVIRPAYDFGVGVNRKIDTAKMFLVGAGLQAVKGKIDTYIDTAASVREKGLLPTLSYQAATAQLMTMPGVKEIYSKIYPGRDLAKDIALNQVGGKSLGKELDKITDKNIEYQLTKGKFSTQEKRAELDKKNNYKTNYGKWTDEQTRILVTTIVKAREEESKQMINLGGVYGQTAEVGAELFGGWWGRGAVAFIEAPTIMKAIKERGLKTGLGENIGTIAGLGLSSAGALAPKIFSWGISPTIQKGAEATGFQKFLMGADKTFVPYLVSSAQAPPVQYLQKKVSEKVRAKITALESEVYNRPNVKAVQDEMNTDFGNLYGDRINSGDITYENAVTEYAKSPAYKNYAEKMGIEYAKSESWGTGGKILALKTADWLTPETPGEVAKFATTWITTFKAIPYAFQALRNYNPIVSRATTYGLGGGVMSKGISTFFNPAAPKEEKIKMGGFGALGALGVGIQLKQDIGFLRSKGLFNPWVAPSGLKQVGIREQQQFGYKDEKGIVHEVSPYATRVTVKPYRIVNGEKQYLVVLDKNTSEWILPGGGKEWIPVDVKGNPRGTFYQKYGVKTMKDYWNKLLTPAEKKEYGSYANWKEMTKIKPEEYSIFWEKMKPALKHDYGSYSQWEKSGAPGTKYIRTMSVLDTARKELGEELGLKPGALMKHLKTALLDTYTGTRYNKVIDLDLGNIKNVKITPGSDATKYNWVKESQLFNIIGNNRMSSASDIYGVQSKGIKGIAKEIFLRSGGRWDLDSSNILLKDAGISKIKGEIIKASSNPKIVSLAQKWISQNYGKQFVNTYTPKEAVQEYLLAVRFPQFGSKGLAGATVPYSGQFDKLIWYGTKTSPLRAVRMGSKGFESWATRGQISRGGEGTVFQNIYRYAPGSRYRLDLPSIKSYITSTVPEQLAHGAPSTFKEKVGDIFPVQGDPTKLQTGLFFQPPTFPGGPPYIGTSYLGTGKEAGFTLIKGSPQIVSQLRIKPPYGQSLKMPRGYELEAIEKGGTMLKVISKGQTIPFSGYGVSTLQVQVQPAKVDTLLGSAEKAVGEVAGKIAEQIPFFKPFTESKIFVGGISSTAFVPKSPLILVAPSSEKKQRPTPQFIITSEEGKSKVTSIILPPISEPPKKKVTPDIVIAPASRTGSLAGPSIVSVEPSPSIITPETGPSISLPRSGPSTVFDTGGSYSLISKPGRPSITTINLPELKKIKTERKKKPKLSGYYVLSYRAKKPYLITPNPLIKGQALAFGVKYTKQTERASFKLIPSKRPAVRASIKPIKETEVFKLGYRPPVRKGKVQSISNVFIQRKPTRMGTWIEMRAIQKYKRAGRGNPIWG